MAQRGALAVAPDAALLLERIQFDDRAVGFVGELFADCVEFGDGGDEFVLGFAKPGAFRRFEAEGFQKIEKLELGLRSAGRLGVVPTFESALRCRRG